VKINLRDYTQEDWPSLEDIILSAENFGEAFLDAEKRKITVFAAHPELGRVLIAEDVLNRQILGYASVVIEWKALVISSIITHHGFLRQGIGRALIEGIKDIAESYPMIDVIRVDTGHFMHYAQEFYKSCGFLRAGFVPHYLSWKNAQVIFVYPVKNRTVEEGNGAEGEI
jgi:ribosomal protein S18 acetylase RimI-like enzyme